MKLSELSRRRESRARRLKSKGGMSHIQNRFMDLRLKRLTVGGATSHSAARASYRPAN